MALVSDFYDWYISKAYLLDWVLTSLVFAFGNQAFLIAKPAKSPLQRVFSLTDPALSYPFKSPTFTDAHMIVFATAFPLLVFAVVSGLWRRNFADWHHITLTWWLASALLQFTIGYMSLVGRYRPNTLDGIKHLGKVSGATWAPNRSYPQSAAAACVCSSSVLFLWSVGQMQLFSRPSKGFVLKLVLAATPIGYGVNLGLSRVADYWVDFSDFNAGCFIGLLMACLGYISFYPWVTSVNSGQPKVDREGWAYGFTTRRHTPANDHFQQLQMSSALSAPVNEDTMESHVIKPGVADTPV